MTMFKMKDIFVDDIVAFIRFVAISHSRNDVRNSSIRNRSRRSSSRSRRSLVVKAVIS